MTLDAGSVLAVLGSLAVAAAAAGFAHTTRPRVAVLAVAVVLVAFPLSVRPLAAPLPLAFWLVAAFLAAYLFLGAARAGPRSFSLLPLGGTAEAAFGFLGLLTGYLVAPIVGPAAGAPALAAGLALGFVALPAVLLGREGLRAGIGATFSAVAAASLGAGLRGAPPDGVLVALALVVISASAATAVFVAPERPAPEPGPRGGARRTARAGRDEA